MFWVRLLLDSGSFVGEMLLTNFLCGAKELAIIFTNTVFGGL
jgi:hypothetical protein